MHFFDVKSPPEVRANLTHPQPPPRRETRARFINRQPGSGTRLLLDHELRLAGLTGQEIEGYECEMYRHLAVAAAAAGGAECGLGILSADRALGLEFIPIAREQYDRAIRADVWDSAAVQALVERDALWVAATSSKAASAFMR
jgi:molybdate-binding protein